MMVLILQFAVCSLPLVGGKYEYGKRRFRFQSRRQDGNLLSISGLPAQAANTEQP
jgi:hypothetical protein